MLPALRVCLCRAGDTGSTWLGGNHRISRMTQLCHMACGLLQNWDLSACWLWLGIPRPRLRLRLGCSGHCPCSARCFPRGLLQDPALELGVSQPPVTLTTSFGFVLAVPRLDPS